MFKDYNLSILQNCCSNKQLNWPYEKYTNLIPIFFQTEVDDSVYINSIIVATFSVVGYMFVGTLINAMGKKNLISTSDL